MDNRKSAVSRDTVRSRSDRSANPTGGDLVIGLDCSTTSVKAIAFDRHGKIAAEAHEPIRLMSPQPNYYEQDPDHWWTAARRSLKTVTRSVDAARSIALSISNQRETFVPLDAKGKALRPAIIWLDERCKAEVEPFARKVGKRRIHRLTGKPPDYAPVVYRLAWMKKREPKLFSSIHMICDVHAFIAWKLTGLFDTSWASADPLGLFDMKRKEWSEPVLKALGMTKQQFPVPRRPGSFIGHITRSAARSTGLTPSTLVIAGGGDGQAAGLGANVLSSARAYLNLGTAIVAGVFGEGYMTSKAFRTMCSCSEDGYYYECSLRAGTFSINWVIRNILKIDPQEKPEIYAQLDREAGAVPAGCDGLLYLPYLCGVMNPYWDSTAKGAFVGLSSSHDRGHLYRSILEGIAFEQLVAIGEVERSARCRVKELAAIGGGASNELWCHIIADVTGRKVSVPECAEASGLGAAMAAAVGAGWYSTFRQAASRMSAKSSTITPNKKRHQHYSRMFKSYQRLYRTLR